MSRSGYTYDIENFWSWIKHRGAVSSAIKGRRGQAFLRDLLDALDAMPIKRLTTEALEEDGDCCAMGALGRARGLTLNGVDAKDYEAVAKLFGIAKALAQEIAFENDEVIAVRKFVEHEGPPVMFMDVPGAWLPEPHSMEILWRHMRDFVTARIEKDIH